MGGAAQLLGDLDDGRVGDERWLVVVAHGAGHAHHSRHEDREAVEQLRIPFEQGAVATPPRVQGEAFGAAGDGIRRGVSRLAQRAGLLADAVELVKGRLDAERGGEAFHRGSHLAGEAGDGEVRGLQGYRRNDEHVDSQPDCGADDRLEDAVDGVLELQASEAEHEHRADRNLVGRPRTELEHPREHQSQNDGGEHDPGARAEGEADAVGEHNTEDDSDAALEPLGNRLVHARLHDEQGGNGGEDRRLLGEQC